MTGPDALAPGSPPDEMKGTLLAEKPSAEGRLIILLGMIILFSPYLPQMGGGGLRVRVDHLLLPLAAVAWAAMKLARGKLRLSAGIWIYGSFIAWLLGVTLYRLLADSASGRQAGLWTMLAGLESHLRPLALLLIAHSASASWAGLRAFVRCALISAMAVSAIAAAQIAFYEYSAFPRLMAELYAGNTPDLYLMILNNGRAPSVFGQVGGMGMYALLSLTLCVGLWLGRGRGGISAPLIWTAAALSIIGGTLSLSKVFFGGAILLAIIMALFTEVLWKAAEKSRGAILAAALGAAATIAVLAYMAHGGDYYSSVIISNLDPRVIYDVYAAPRFGSLDDPGSGKLFRTGSLAIASEYPLIGLGLSAIPYTTDSFLMGLMAMGGAVGLAIYFAFIMVILRDLYLAILTAEEEGEPELAMMTLIFTIICVIASAGFPMFTQDKAGDIYWLLVGLISSITYSILEKRNERAGAIA